MSASQRTQSSTPGTESGPKKLTVKWGVEMSSSPTQPSRGTQSWLTGEHGWSLDSGGGLTEKISTVVTWGNVLVIGNAVAGSMM